MDNFLHNTKIPIISPVLVNGELISGFHKKADLFKDHFASQCTPTKNTSKLPNFNYKTNERLTSVDINKYDIPIFMKNINVDNAHGWDNLSIMMIKISGKSKDPSLKLIFI